MTEPINVMFRVRPEDVDDLPADALAEMVRIAVREAVDARAAEENAS